MPDEHTSYAYRPGLDGVRALAVAAVVLFHGGVPGMSGGFLGVDAFFVLSGFLITSLLLAEQERYGRIALPAFWARRVRRLLPALLVLLVVVTVAGRWLLPPVEDALLRGDGLSALGYVANWRMIYRGAGYFAATAAPSPLQHTWSLGIEEQFYLLWPLVVVALAGRRRLLLALCVAGTIASALLAWFLYRPDDVDRAYFGTDTRAQALLVGCALAVLAARGYTMRSWIFGVLALGGAAVTGWLWVHATGTDAWLYHGGFTVAAVSVAAVIAHAVRAGSLTARLLGVPPLVWLGKISYGVYLWHWPLFQFLTAERTGLVGPWLLVVRCASTLLIAVVSYVAVELPVRRGRLRVPVPVVVGALAACAAVVVVSTVPTSAVPASAPMAADGAAPPGPIPSVPSLSVPSLPTTPGVSAPPRAPGPPRVEIFGDSVAWTIGAYLPAHPGVVVDNNAIQGCGITLQPDILTMGSPHQIYPYCPGWPAHWQGAINKDRPDAVVVLLNRWELMDAKLNGNYQHVGQPAFDAYLTGQLDEAVRIAGSGGARIYLLTAAYTHRAERPDGGLYPEDQPSRVDAWNTLLRQEAAKHPSTVTVLDLNRLVCPAGVFTWSVDGVRIRSDGLHFTPAGVQKVVAPWLLPLVAPAAAR